jgi:hypothetical protein
MKTIRNITVITASLICVFVSIGCGGGTLNVNPPLAVATTSLPNGVVGAQYSSTLQATGGNPPYLWSVSGTLPYGLSLNKAGSITGTPGFAGTASSLFFQVTDSLNASANVTLSIVINPEPMPPAIITKSLPAGTVGMPYSWAIQTTGGTTPYEWELKSGTLPAGLSFSAITGAISGTPTTAGTFDDLVFLVTDATGLTALSSDLSITVNP